MVSDRRGRHRSRSGNRDCYTSVTIGNIENWKGVVTYVSDLETTILMLRDTVDGAVCSRSRVVDGLLDLRLEADGRSDVIELLDTALAELPGQSTVPTDWWREQLDMLELVAINPSNRSPETRAHPEGDGRAIRNRQTSARV